MTLGEDLRHLAAGLTEATWRTKHRRDWTPEERAAYERWNRAAVTEIRKSGARVDVVVALGDDEPPYEPTITITFDRRAVEGEAM